MKQKQERMYQRKDSVVFLKTDGPFGGLSNMAGGYPVWVNGTNIRTVEALYQSCRFPLLPEVQKIIISQKSPMTAKEKSKLHLKETRADWNNVRVNIMRWCLRVKLVCNWNSFSALLLSTGDKAIVEESYKDVFWGAKPSSDGSVLIGMNILGRLLMELREEVKEYGKQGFVKIDAPKISSFQLLSEPIKAVRGGVKDEVHCLDKVAHQCPQRGFEDF
ncbi:NADAR family protein [Thiomicrospira sp. XS5]|uniref:NADAR family protein n=1 Tax=Thiomicrospira sp. XS5 TaxID=1775636 RepID=UPI0009E8AE73|nr:NADAR family protein [Thiomicrospira sp. XS5]